MPRPYPPVGMPPYAYPVMAGMHPQMMMPPNAPMPAYMPYPQVPVQEAVVVPQQQVLSNDKETLGEHLYALVDKKDSKNAAKITGMLLEMEIEQIHDIIRNPNQLDKWISEALKVLDTSAPSS